MKKRIVRQVGYLQGLNRDARSTEHKIIYKHLKREIHVSNIRYKNSFSTSL